MFVLADDRGGFLELTELFAIEGEAAGHAKVAAPGLSGRQRHQQVFGAAVDALDDGPLEPLDKAVGKGKAQVGAVLAHAGQARAGQYRLKAAPDGFDLGEFRHGGQGPGLRD